MNRPPFSLAALDHVVLRVPDMRKALAFYGDVLGARVERTIERFGMVQLRTGDSIIDLVDVNTAWLRTEGRSVPKAATSTTSVCASTASTKRRSRII